MKPWFRTDERQAALWAEQQRWLDTPFFPFAASRGHGVDCVNLQHEIFVALGAIPRLTLPRYSLDRAKHTTTSQLLMFLMTAPAIVGRFMMVPPAGELLAGDLIAAKSGRVDHHLACVTPHGEVVHAVEEVGVIRTALNDETLRERTIYVLRLLES